MGFFAYVCYINLTIMSNTNPRPNVNPLALPKLAFAGRAVLTFRNLRTGTHMTVKLKQLRDKKDRNKKLPIFYVFISLLGDGRQSYEFAGTLFQEDLRIKLGRTVAGDSRLARALYWLVGAIRNPQSLRGRAGLFHEGRCCACGQPLTHPESIHTALGPVCLKRLLEQGEGFRPVKVVYLSWTVAARLSKSWLLVRLITDFGRWSKVSSSSLSIAIGWRLTAMIGLGCFAINRNLRSIATGIS